MKALPKFGAVSTDLTLSDKSVFKSFSVIKLAELWVFESKS